MKRSGLRSISPSCRSYIKSNDTQPNCGRWRAPRCLSAFKALSFTIDLAQSGSLRRRLEKIAECAETSGCELFCSDFRADKGVNSKKPEPIRVLRRRSEACWAKGNTRMATFTELRKMAHDLYARARASRNPFTKHKFRKSADVYLEEAEQLRRSQNIQKRLFQKN
jgi:hypothetical protein